MTDFTARIVILPVFSCYPGDSVLDPVAMSEITGNLEARIAALEGAAAERLRGGDADG
jgi:hypothetical protein